MRKPGFARQVRTWSRDNPGSRIPRRITIELSPGSTIGGVLRNPRSVGFDFTRENLTLKPGETAQIQIHGSATSGK